MGENTEIPLLVHRTLRLVAEVHVIQRGTETCKIIAVVVPHEKRMHIVH